MADSIISAAGNSNPRILNPASIAALQTKVAPTIIQHAQKPAVVKVQASAVPQGSKTATPSPQSILPRGSIVDRLV